MITIHCKWKNGIVWVWFNEKTILISICQIKMSNILWQVVKSKLWSNGYSGQVASKLWIILAYFLLNACTAHSNIGKLFFGRELNRNHIFYSVVVYYDVCTCSYLFGSGIVVWCVGVIRIGWWRGSRWQLRFTMTWFVVTWFVRPTV